MANEWPFLDIPAGAAVAVLGELDAKWPEPTRLSPAGIGLVGEHRSFLLAIVTLQDAGWLMCEALLAGTGQEPCAVDAVLTAKGRSALAHRRGSA